MKLSVFTVLGMFAISCGGAIQPAARLDTAAAPTASFGQYHTFSMGLVESGSIKETPPRTLEEQAVIRDLIVVNLESKGYLSEPRQGLSDIVVRFGSADGEARTPETAVNPDNHETVYEGAIQVDVYDSASGLRAWHGSIALPLRRNHVDASLLERSVTELLSSFPSHRAG
jgi:hypothetical protein